MENTTALNADEPLEGDLHDDDLHDDDLHILPDKTQLNVFVALIALTAITVTASVKYPGQIGIGVALVVTPLKASLILMYFMHLKFERPVFIIMFLVAISILAVVMGLTILDYQFR